MTARIVAVAVVLMLMGGGIIWLCNIVIQNERAKTLQVAVEKMAERDKVKKIAKEATDADLCRLLGGQTIDGVCQ